MSSLHFQHLIDEQLKESQGMCEYALYIQGLPHLA